MKQQFVKRNNFNLSDVDALVECGFSRARAEVLSSRGVNASNVNAFFDGATFYDTSLMKNLDEAAETLSYVMESGGSVLIYGDYDADGLTASAILSLFLTDNGVDNDVVIPTREQGYGLHVENVAKAFENKYYDLIVTVDCGISNVDEIDEILRNFDTEIVVTDHHELPEKLPNCLCVNPKMDYPFPMLAGAGVAWKLVEAVAGREAAKNYALLAAIGTIADIMPLTDENRSIVKAGLANVNHKSLLRLAELSKVTLPMTSVDVAMKIAPKINAAGRVGNPQSALKLLLSRDKTDVKVVDNLMEMNELRKQLCEQIIAEARQKIDVKAVKSKRMVFIFGEWQHGLLGIVASRFKEEFGLPCMVMTSDGDNFVGSARSVDGVNLFEAFCQADDLLVKFGGHRASVGFTVAKSNLSALEKRLSDYFCSLPESAFEKISYYDVDVDGSESLADLYGFAQSLEPILPQEKPIFRVRGTVKFGNVFGKDKNHLSLVLDGGTELKGFFSFARFGEFIGGSEVDVLCTLDYDNYSKNIYGVITDMQLVNSLVFDQKYRENHVRMLKNEHLTAFCDGKNATCGQSVLVVFDDCATFLNYSQNGEFDDFGIDFFVRSNSFSKTVVIAPCVDYPFDHFDKIVVFTAEKLAYRLPENAVYVKVTPADESLYDVKMNRDVCVAVYSAMRNKQKFDSVRGTFDKYLASKISYEQFLLAMSVFDELGLVKVVDEFTVDVPKADKISLESSVLYNRFCKS